MTLEEIINTYNDVVKVVDKKKHKNKKIEHMVVLSGK